MKAENSNRILPIKSLLQNLKQETKKQYLQLDNKNHTFAPTQNPATPRIIQQSSIPTVNKPYLLNDSSNSHYHKQHQKGISLNKPIEQATINHIPKQSAPSFELGYPSFYTPRKEKNHFESSSRFSILTQQPFKIDTHTDHYYITNKVNKSEQFFYQQLKQQAKEKTKNPQNKGHEDHEKESFTLTDKLNSKFQEETRYVSKFEKMESLPIFKDELTKIKTELFQKEATLFQKTQELQEKEKIIKILQNKLQLSGSSDRIAKQKISSKQKELIEVNQTLRKRNEDQEKCLQKLVQKVQILEEKISNHILQNDGLRAELEKSTEVYSRYQQDNANNYALINLKLRQYEAEEKEKSHQLIEMKDRERKSFEHQEKVIKGLNQLLRQKEEIIAEITSKSSKFEQQVQNANNVLKEREESYTKQIENKDLVIRELSAEVGDLKNNLKNMELRIREMIEEQEEHKKNVEEKTKQIVQFDLKIKQYEANYLNIMRENDRLATSHIKHQEQSQKSINALQSQVTSLQKSLNSLIQAKSTLEDEIKDFHLKFTEAKQLYQVKDCLHQTSHNDLKAKIAELNEIIFKRENSLIVYKEKNSQLEQKLKKNCVPNRISPPKTSTSKLIKDNEKLNQIVKNLDSRLYQSFKLTQVLNEQVAKRELMMLNDSLRMRFQKDIQ